MYLIRFFFFQIDEHVKENLITLSTNDVFMSWQDNSDENVDYNNGIFIILRFSPIIF